MNQDHIAAALLWLASFFCGYAALSVVIAIWKRERQRHAEKWMKFLLSVQAKRNDRGYARLAGVFTTVLIVSWSFSGFLALRDHRQIDHLEKQLSKYEADTVVEHHVKFLRKTEDGDFAFISDEKPDGDAFRPCPS